MFYPSSSPVSKKRSKSSKKNSKNRSKTSKHTSPRLISHPSSLDSTNATNPFISDYDLIQSQFGLTLSQRVFKNGFKYDTDNDYEQILKLLDVENLYNPYPIFEFDPMLIDETSITSFLSKKYEDQYKIEPERYNNEYKNIMSDIILHNDFNLAKTFFNNNIPAIDTSIILKSQYMTKKSKFKINSQIMNASINYETASYTDINSIPLYMVVLSGGRELAKHIVLSVILNKKLHTIGLITGAELLSPDFLINLTRTKNKYKILDIGIFRHKYAVNLNNMLSHYQELNFTVFLSSEYAGLPPMMIKLKSPVNFIFKQGRKLTQTIYNYSRLYTGRVFKENNFQTLLNCARFVVDILTEKSNIPFIPNETRLHCGILENNLIIEPSDPFKCDTIPPFDERAPYIYILLNKLSKSSNESDYIEILENLIKLLDLKSYSHYIEHPFR